MAALFALHPLHVESVAWIAERRDVLSGLFFMLTLGAYGEYVRHPRSLGRYLAVVGLFALGLHGQVDAGDAAAAVVAARLLALGTIRPSASRGTPRRRSRAAGAVSLAGGRGKAAAFGIGPRRGRRDHAHPRCAPPIR